MVLLESTYTFRLPGRRHGVHVEADPVEHRPGCETSGRREGAMSTSRDGMRCWVEECGRDAIVYLTLDESASEQEALGVDVCVLHASRMLHDGRWTLTMSLRAARDAHLKRTV